MWNGLDLNHLSIGTDQGLQTVMWVDAVHPMEFFVVFFNQIPDIHMWWFLLIICCFCV